MAESTSDIWVLGDYRNYFQNRVTLQLLAQARELAKKTGGSVSAVVIGHDVGQWANEYIAHGAEKIYRIQAPELRHYDLDAYAFLMTQLINTYQPAIVLIGATMFGRELAPKLAKKVNTGLTADCVDLDIDDTGLLVQTAPAFGGNLLAKIVTPVKRPQMATVRPGIFQERPHDNNAKGDIIDVAKPGNMPPSRIRRVSVKKHAPKAKKLENASVVICGGRGMGSKAKYKKLFELADILEGQVGATRPVVYAKWVDEQMLVGQSGKQIHPKLLFSFGVSGAIQHTQAIQDAKLTIAVNKNKNATMMKMADVAVVADANQFCTAIIKELKKRIR